MRHRIPIIAELGRGQQQNPGLTPLSSTLTHASYSRVTKVHPSEAVERMRCVRPCIYTEILAQIIAQVKSAMYLGGAAKVANEQLTPCSGSAKPPHAVDTVKFQIELGRGPRFEPISSRSAILVHSPAHEIMAAKLCLELLSWSDRKGPAVAIGAYV